MIATGRNFSDFQRRRSAESVSSFPDVPTREFLTITNLAFVNFPNSCSSVQQEFIYCLPNPLDVRHLSTNVNFSSQNLTDFRFGTQLNERDAQVVVV